jgi:hypothetical protein
MTTDANTWGARGNALGKGLFLSPCARPNTHAPKQHANASTHERATHAIPPTVPRQAPHADSSFDISPAKALLRASPRSRPKQLDGKKDEEAPAHRPQAMLQASPSDVAASLGHDTLPQPASKQRYVAPDNKDAHNNAIGDDAPSKVGHATGEKCGRQHRQLYGLQPTRRNSTHANPRKRTTKAYDESLLGSATPPLAVPWHTPHRPRDRRIGCMPPRGEQPLHARNP